MVTRIGMLLAAATVALLFAFGLEFGERLLPAGGFEARLEAIIGRPFTPVSVAGVARRTARRCAVGVYNC